VFDLLDFVFKLGVFDLGLVAEGVKVFPVNRLLTAKLLFLLFD